jgi:hypothetical protein
MQLISRFLFVATTVFVVTSTASAYDLDTHAVMAYASFRQSVLADPGYRRQLDVRHTERPYGTTYFEIAGDSAIERPLRSITNRYIPRNLRESVIGWLMRGAIREDDYPFVYIPLLSCFEFGNDPAREWTVARVLNVFRTSQRWNMAD